MIFIKCWCDVGKLKSFCFKRDLKVYLYFLKNINLLRSFSNQCSHLFPLTVEIWVRAASIYTSKQMFSFDRIIPLAWMEHPSPPHPASLNTNVRSRNLLEYCWSKLLQTLFLKASGKRNEIVDQMLITR